MPTSTPESAGLPVSQCVRSGFCCKQAPCGFGTWDADRRQCKHLEVEAEIAPGVFVHRCGIYDQIKDQPGADVSPAFGAGCCSPLFNTARSRIIRLTKERLDLTRSE